MASATYYELLRNNRNFRRLWLGQMISELGTWFSFIAELGLVRLYSGSPMVTTALLVARLLPFLLAAPLAGVFADRLSRKHTMIATDMLRALVALSLLAAASLRSPWIVVVCSALMSSLSMFFEAAKNASMPNLVRNRELLTANVLMYSTRFLQFTFGSALGGVTAVGLGYEAAFVINAVSFVVSALFIIPIPSAATRQQDSREGTWSDDSVVPDSGNSRFSADSAGSVPLATSEQPVARSRVHFFGDLREGLRYIWSTPFVRGVILVNIGWATGGGMTNILINQMALQVSGRGEGDRGDWLVASLFTAGGAGLFVGMMLARRAGIWVADQRRAGHFIGWSLLAHGLFFGAGGLMPSVGLMALLIAASRLVLGMEFGVQETLMMRMLPDQYRGRVFTTDRSLELSTMALSTVLAGWLLGWFSPHTLMVVAGLLSASPGLIWLLAMGLKRFSVPAQAVQESYGD